MMLSSTALEASGKLADRPTRTPSMNKDFFEMDDTKDTWFHLEMSKE